MSYENPTCAPAPVNGGKSNDWMRLLVIMAAGASVGTGGTVGVQQLLGNGLSNGLSVEIRHINKELDRIREDNMTASSMTIEKLEGLQDQIHKLELVIQNASPEDVEEDIEYLKRWVNQHNHTTPR